MNIEFELDAVDKSRPQRRYRTEEDRVFRPLGIDFQEVDFADVVGLHKAINVPHGDSHGSDLLPVNIRKDFVYCSRNPSPLSSRLIVESNGPFVLPQSQIMHADPRIALKPVGKPSSGCRIGFEAMNRDGMAFLQNQIGEIAFVGTNVEDHCRFGMAFHFLGPKSEKIYFTVQFWANIAVSAPVI